VAISLLKYLDDAWEAARGPLREDLDHIEAAFNTFTAKMLTPDGYLRKGVIKTLLSGDSTNQQRVVTNDGNGVLVFGQVNLSTGVTGILPISQVTDGAAIQLLVSHVGMVDLGNSGATPTLDFASAPFGRFIMTLSANATITLSNPYDGGTYAFLVRTGSGSHTLTWPGTVKWPLATPPVITTTASRVDLITLIYSQTENAYYGSFNQNYS
jgi:hypothetical protein